MGLKDSNASRQLSPTVHLPFYFTFQSLDLSLLHACFRGNYAMLSGTMEIISRMEPFDRVITFLEVTGLHGFSYCTSLLEFDTSVIYHLLIFCFCSFLM